MAQFAPTVPRVDGNVFLVLAYDIDEGSAAFRQSELDGHLEYIEKHCDQYLVCGPLRNPGESALVGSFFLLVAEDADAVTALVSGDPYFQCGMYADVQVREATPAGGRFMGGVIWESADAVRDKAS